MTPGYYWKLLRFTDCVDWLINLIIRYIRLTWLFNLHREINFARKSAIVCTAWFPSLTLFLISSSLVLCIALLECLMKRYKCFIFFCQLVQGSFPLQRLSLQHYVLLIITTTIVYSLQSHRHCLCYPHQDMNATPVPPSLAFTPLTGRITAPRATLSDRPLTTWSYSIINCLGYPYRKDLC